jgi:hypothetical protein
LWREESFTLPRRWGESKQFMRVVNGTTARLFRSTDSPTEAIAKTVASFHF